MVYKSKIKLLISYHKPSVLLKNDIFMPVHSGRAEYIKKYLNGFVQKEDYDWMMENTIGDDTGDNISQLNHDFNELTTVYWAWKNYDAIESPDYIGFMHYRRQFIFDKGKNNSSKKNVEVTFKKLDQNVLKIINCNSDVIENVISNYDVIAAKPLDNGMTVFEYYKKCHIISELDFCINVICNEYPLLYPCAKRFFKQNLNSCCNMFIMKRELFFEYCQFLFGIAFNFLQNYDRSNYSIDDSRMFVLERMTAFYLYYLSQYKNIRFSTLPITFLEQPQIVQDYYPAFQDNNIPIIFSSSEEYLKYCAIAIRSIIDNSNINNTYDIFIMTKKISDFEKDRIMCMINNHKNFSIRFVEIDIYLDQFVEYSGEINLIHTFKSEAYHRLLIPKIFYNYKKVLYLDCDIIVEKDIAELYYTNINDYFIGASSDIEFFCLYYENRKSTDKYIENVLKLSDPYEYIQTGVLLFNIEELNKSDYFNNCLDFIRKNVKTYFFVQDVINYVCKNKIFRFSIKWNVDWHSTFILHKHQLSKLLPKKYYEEYMEAREDAYILHFTGIWKPWSQPEKQIADVFWKYARCTPFYETILFAELNKKSHAKNQSVYRLKCNNNRLLKKIEQIFIYKNEYGLRFTLKLLMNKIIRAL